eukprot:g7096.t1
MAFPLNYVSPPLHRCKLVPFLFQRERYVQSSCSVPVASPFPFVESSVPPQVNNMLPCSVPLKLKDDIVSQLKDDIETQLQACVGRRIAIMNNRYIGSGEDGIFDVRFCLKTVDESALSLALQCISVTTTNNKENRVDTFSALTCYTHLPTDQHTRLLASRQSSKVY